MDLGSGLFWRLFGLVRGPFVHLFLPLLGSGLGSDLFWRAFGLVRGPFFAPFLTAAWFGAWFGLVLEGIFTDRGTGMYTSAGKAVACYADAVEKAGFRLFWGLDAQRQSPDMGDVLLHETAVSWFRKRMREEKPDVAPWQETEEQWAQRANRSVARMNKDYDVAGLCRQFRNRLQDVVDSEGDRLRQ